MNYMKNVDCTFVVGTRNEYDHPEYFDDACNHAEEEVRMKWRKAIKKEIGDKKAEESQKKSRKEIFKVIYY